MIYGSICSGIEAASLAWKPLGWHCRWVAEIDPFCNALLAQHYPEVENRGDFTTIQESGPIDVLIGGTPCQSYSIAGRRGGIADQRGNLALEYARLIGRIKPRWIVWENVPGVLSINGGRDFGAILGALAECGYGFAYRVLDAQFFGVGQRRRRVFIIGKLGDWRDPAAVLSFPEGLPGDPPARREAGSAVARTVSASASTRGGYRFDPNGEELIPVAFSCKDHGADAGDLCPTIRSMEFDVSHMNGGGQVAIAFDPTQITNAKNYSNPQYGDPCHPIAASAYPPHIAQHRFVRRLTPREIERLFGIPDDYTLIEYHGKPAADSQRYRALGNSFAVPVIRWLGERIATVDAMTVRQ